MTQADAKLPAESAENNIIDDKALIRRFSQGDGSAFDKIVEKCSVDIGGPANRLLYREGNVEDVVRDIFLALAAFSGILSRNEISSDYHWAYGVFFDGCNEKRTRPC